MERHEILDAMSELKLYGMRARYRCRWQSSVLPFYLSYQAHFERCSENGKARFECMRIASPAKPEALANRLNRGSYSAFSGAWGLAVRSREMDS